MQMLFTSKRTLNMLAALTWYIGGVVLLLKGRSLLLEASELEPGQLWPWLAAAAGVAVGVLEARRVFVKACTKNLARIAVLEQPQLWQFFRPGFFLALAVMIAAGATLSRLASGNYAFLLGVAALDMALSTALLVSSAVFWRQKAFTN